MWAPKGKRPILRRVERDRRAISTAVGFTLSGKIYKRHFTGSMKSEQIIESLRHMQRHVPESIIIVWDGASIHKSRKTQAYLDAHPEIRIEPLPPYAPEVNPEEYCRGNAKQHLRNITPRYKHGNMWPARPRVCTFASSTRPVAEFHPSCGLICKATLVKRISDRIDLNQVDRRGHYC